MPATDVLGRDDLSATFARDDGPPITLYGPAAIQFADELAARKAERTAQAAPAAPPTSVPDAAGPAPAPSPPTSVDAAAAAMADAAGGRPAAPVPSPPAPPAAAPPAPAQPVGSGMTFGGAVPQPKAEPWPMVHSPGVSRGQLQQKATQGVWTPGTQSIETEGAVPISPEIEGARAELMQRELAREAQRHETEQARLAVREGAAWNAAVAMQDEAAQQEERLRQAQGKAAAARARVEQIDTVLTEQRANPADFFERRGGGWARVAAAVAMGIGQYAAILGGGRNAAQDIIFKAIDDDTAAEKDNYLRNRDTRNSLVARLTAELGDLDVAVEAAKALKTRQALAMGERLALGEKQDDAKLEHGKLLDGIRGKYLDHLDAVQKTALGKTVIRTQGAMKYPVAGGSRPMTEDEIIDRQIKKNERQTRLAKSENEKRFQQGGAPMGGEHAEKAAERGAKGAKAERELWVEGYGPAKTKEQQVAASNVMAEANARKQQLDDLDKKAQNWWTKVPGSKEYVEGKAAYEQMVVITAKGFGGTITESDREAAARLVPDPTTMLRGETKSKAKISEAKKYIDSQAREAVRQMVSGKAVEGAPTQRKTPGVE